MSSPMSKYTCIYCGQTNDKTDDRGGCLACGAPIHSLVAADEIYKRAVVRLRGSASGYIGEEIEPSDMFETIAQFINREIIVEPRSVKQYSFYQSDVLRSIDLRVPAIGDQLRIMIVVNGRICLVDVYAYYDHYRFPLEIRAATLCDIRIELENKSDDRIKVNMIESRLIATIKERM